ncbi:MAG: ATP-binding protein [Pseudobutyrivibrio ruminis]|nr:ATP-binding protein [Pseudobutyrivibrio ruminis]
MDRLSVDAKIENLYQITDYVEEKLETIGVSQEHITSICIAIEEVYVNIASYAYKDEAGKVDLEIDTEDSSIKIRFIDGGTPYNPLEKDDPDINLPADEREQGGLGIFMIKQIMDTVEYEYKDSQNILTLTKHF